MKPEIAELIESGQKLHDAIRTGDPDRQPKEGFDLIVLERLIAALKEAYKPVNDESRRILERLQVCIESEDGYWPTVLAQNAHDLIERLARERDEANAAADTWQRQSVNQKEKRQEQQAEIEGLKEAHNSMKSTMDQAIDDARHADECLVRTRKQRDQLRDAITMHMLREGYDHTAADLVELFLDEHTPSDVQTVATKPEGV